MNYIVNMIAKHKGVYELYSKYDRKTPCKENNERKI